jgi:hypothetical protein
LIFLVVSSTRSDGDGWKGQIVEGGTVESTQQHAPTEAGSSQQPKQTSTGNRNTMAPTAAAPQQSAEDLEKSIDATLAQFRSSFNNAPTLRTSNASSKNADSSAKPNRDALNSEAYYSRLKTFRAETYFAKPLNLSPLNCAAFGYVALLLVVVVFSHYDC